MILSETFQWRIQDFLNVGDDTSLEGCQYMILPNFPKNCRKLKEFGPLGGTHLSHPP